MSLYLPDTFRRNPPADPGAVSAVGLVLPGDYEEFLRRSNGGEGILSNGAHVVLWRAEELLRFNAEYETRKYAPQAFFFGSDGGGEGYAFDLRTDPRSIVQLPFIGMAMKDAWFLAGSFASFLGGDWKAGEE